MANGVAKIYILHTPAVALELMHNYPMKVLVVHRIVRAESSSIIVIDDTVIGMGRIYVQKSAMSAGFCAQISRKKIAVKIARIFQQVPLCSCRDPPWQSLQYSANSFNNADKVILPRTMYMLTSFVQRAYFGRSKCLHRPK